MPEFFDFLLHSRPFVRDDQETRSLHFNIDALQSLMSCERPFDLEVPYTKTMMGFLLARPAPEHILMIGLGGGSLAKFCYHNLQQTRITVVEINPHVIAMRQQFLIPDDDERFSVVCTDGAHFVRDTRPGFDVVLVDGFDCQGQSAQLSTRAFYENCCRIMAPSSVLVLNLDNEHPGHPVSIARIDLAFERNAVEIEVVERSNSIVFAGKGIAISARGMSLSGALGPHTHEAQTQLKAEFQRILQILDRSEALGQGTDASQYSVSPSSQALLFH